MNIPKKIDILGVKYRIKFVKDVEVGISKLYPADAEEQINETTMGYTCFEKGLILIKYGMSREMTESTVIHEILEAINEQLALHLKHDKICMLENAIYQVFSKNSFYNPKDIDR